MAKPGIPTTPHTQSQQNTNFAQTDVNPDELEQSVGDSVEGEVYANRDASQSGVERSPRHTAGSASPHTTEPEAVAHEGSVTSRTSDDATRQGISRNSAKIEGEGQKRVVDAREDAQAGLNHSNKVPRQGHS